MTRYTYVSPREWTGTWRLLIVCALAYAGLLAASILFDLIRLPVSFDPSPPTYSHTIVQMKS